MLIYNSLPEHSPKGPGLPRNSVEYHIGVLHWWLYVHLTDWTKSAKYPGCLEKTNLLQKVGVKTCYDSGGCHISEIFGGPSDLKHISISPLMLRTSYCILHLVTLSLESPLDCNEIKPVNPKGNQSWIFIGRTNAEAEAPIFLLPDAKSQFIGKDSDAGKDGRQEKGTTEDEMVG